MDLREEVELLEADVPYGGVCDLAVEFTYLAMVLAYTVTVTDWSELLCLAVGLACGGRIPCQDVGVPRGVCAPWSSRTSPCGLRTLPLLEASPTSEGRGLHSLP